ncbi:hypothetical protein HDU96_006026 [Phlyctochytrium bullatum]|nr:hypothetical protein HDU96_006026 [Phlyctochytrium bullatum]
MAASSSSSATQNDCRVLAGAFPALRLPSLDSAPAICCQSNITGNIAQSFWKNTVSCRNDRVVAITTTTTIRFRGTVAGHRQLGEIKEAYGTNASAVVSQFSLDREGGGRIPQGREIDGQFAEWKDGRTGSEVKDRRALARRDG